MAMTVPWRLGWILHKVDSSSRRVILSTDRLLVHMMKTVALVVLLVLTPTAFAQMKPLRLQANKVTMANGKSFTLNLPKEFALSVAVEGLNRVRFMAKSPDDRIFVTDMYNLTDNKRGAVYILSDFDEQSRTFKKVVTYMKGLRNPNSIAFHTDENGVDWFYLALTDRLVRYKFTRGETAPSSEPQVLATFPDYGLAYKYGGWHLTRTIVIGTNSKLYISVGSSCNACEEKEEVRASILEMDLDGKHQRHFARGLRNAVGLRWVDGKLLATNMGSDHLGDSKPADTMYEVKDGTNYGWPYCYQFGARVFIDEKLNPRGRRLNCRNVPQAYEAFDAHSSPLGLEIFDRASNPVLGGYALVALHGSTKKSLNRGYRVVRVAGAQAPIEDFITGFINQGVINGRPVDILNFGQDAFLLTDDRAGAIYYVYKE
jgi:glucose/arabinose dehydrogenase